MSKKKKEIDYSDCIRGYYISKEAWYYPLVPDLDVKHTDEIMMGMYYSNNDGTLGELAVRWYQMNNEHAPRLEIFDDAWGVLKQFNDVIEKLSKVNNENITVSEFVSILETCGFKDITKREREQ